MLLALFLVSLVCLLVATRAMAATDSTVNFQARLMTAGGGIVPDGNYNVEFKLYNASTSSGSSQGSCTGDANCLWTETRTGANQVRVANGYLTVSLGSVSSFPAINWDQGLWLTMNIGGTSGSPVWDGEMSPRLQLTAVPYAFRAGQLVTNTGTFASTLGFVTPTANRSILLPDEGGTLCIQNSVNCGFALSSGSGNYIQNTTSVQSANMNVQAASSGSVAAVLQANAGGTGDILDLKNGSSVNVATFGSSGAVMLQNAANSTTAFQVRPNGSSIDVLDVDTTNSYIGIGNNAPTTNLDVGPATLGASQIVQIRVGDIIVQSQQGSSDSITASTTRGSNGNLMLDGASGSAVYLSPSTTNNNFLAAGGGKVTIGGQDAPTANLSFENGANRSINVLTAASGAGNTLTLQGGGGASGNNAGGGLTLQGGTATGTATGGLTTLQGGSGGTGAAALGGNVLIQGGTANGTGVSNGGNITLQGGTAAGTGTKGLITINGGLIYTTVAYSSAVTATVTQSSVDSYTTILATATATNLVFTVPSPTITTAGRMLNITNTGTNPFTLIAGSLSYILSAGNTAVLVWSGSTWTSAGASSLQAAYGLSTGGTSTTPTIKLINGIGDINIQDADGGLGGGNFLSLRSQNASGLGSVVFGFGIKGQFFEQPSTDTATAVQVENHAGNTLFAIDSSSGYINIGSTGGATGGTGSAFNGTTTNIENSPNANTATNIGSTAQNSGTATINIGYTNTSGGNSIVNIGSGPNSIAGGTTTIQGNGVTITASAASTWSTTSGALTLQGAGGININTGNVANTIQIGSTSLSSGTQTINIGTNGTAGGVQAVTIGSLLTTSTTLIQGGTGTSAISLAPATNGSITETTTGTGNITLSSAANVIVKGTNSSSTFQLQNTSGTATLNFNTNQGVLTTYGGTLTVNGVANPAAPSLSTSTTGGSLAAHTYAYRIDAIGGDGTSTSAGIASSPGSIPTTGTTSKNTLTWTAVPYATGYDVYRSIDSGAWFGITVGAGVTTIVDNGSTYTWNPGASFSNFNNAGGIDLQRGTGLTFDAGSGGTYQMELYDNVNGGDTLTMGNYNTGGTIDIQAHNFYLTDVSTFTHDFTLADTGAITLKSNTASLASAFSIQNSTGVSMFNVNTSTTSERITIGPSGGDTVGEVLVLGIKNGSSTDPTGSSGSMYYNSTSNLFRCYQNGEWRNCVSSVQSNGLSVAAGSGTTTSTSYSNLPSSSSVTLTKNATATKLLISVSTSWRTNVNPSASMLGVNIGGTDYDCTRTTFNTANAHQQISCSLVVSSIPAGSVTVQLRWKIFSGTSPTLTIDSNDWVSVSVLETD